MPPAALPHRGRPARIAGGTPRAQPSFAICPVGKSARILAFRKRHLVKKFEIFLPYLLLAPSLRTEVEDENEILQPENNSFVVPRTSVQTNSADSMLPRDAKDDRTSATGSNSGSAGTAHGTVWLLLRAGAISVSCESLGSSVCARCAFENLGLRGKEGLLFSLPTRKELRKFQNHLAFPALLNTF